jgi:hypothetical protein
MSDIMQLVKNKEKVAEPQVSFFKDLYNKLKDKDWTEADALGNDLTLKLYAEIEDKVDHNELVNWGVIGEVATGKSTVMADLKFYGNAYLMNQKKLFMEGNGKQNSKKVKSFDPYSMIISDQVEFLSFIKGEPWNCFTGIDEFNRLAGTGLNSSVEGELFATYSDVFAQQFVHRISCSPAIINDVNCWLILEVYGKDEGRKITTLKIYYRNVMNGERLCLGVAHIPVGRTIDQKWYQKYRKKKFSRMDLIQKHGIRKVTELEMAGIVLKSYKELEDLVIDGEKADGDTVLLRCKDIIRQEVFFASMLGEQEIASAVRGLLGVRAKVNKVKMKIWKEEKRKKPNEKTIEILERKLELQEEILKKALERQEFYVKLYKEYLGIK